MRIIIAFPSVGLSVAIFCRRKLEVITGKSNFYKRISTTIPNAGCKL